MTYSWKSGNVTEYEAERAEKWATRVSEFTPKHIGSISASDAVAYALEILERELERQGEKFYLRYGTSRPEDTDISFKLEENKITYIRNQDYVDWLEYNYVMLAKGIEIFKELLKK